MGVDGHWNRHCDRQWAPVADEEKIGRRSLYSGQGFGHPPKAERIGNVEAR